ncbi:lytic murein transglycosylase [Lichenifustis flavocetrariae]|nr:lytic murein transglycosylase [Lichenifustis flavocetrariae]
MVAVFGLSTLAQAQSCSSDPSGFPAWLEQFKQEAVSQGISQQAVASALDDVTYDRNTISHDRGQKVFKQSFEQFSTRMANNFRVTKGKGLIRRYADLFARIEHDYGVQAPVLVAIWGLETDFGAYIGNFQTLRSLATLAYDCRRSAQFRAELMDALRIVDRGDMAPSAMRGAWAGEIGQTQFMPSSYVKFAVDYDGTGRRDLVHSVPDVLASTAKFLRSYGWQAGQGWDPGEANFGVIQQWNKSDIYSRTIALLADKIAGQSN